MKMKMKKTRSMVEVRSATFYDTSSSDSNSSQTSSSPSLKVRVMMKTPPEDQSTMLAWIDANGNSTTKIWRG